MDSSKQSFMDLMDALNKRMEQFEGELQRTPASNIPSTLAAEFAAFKTCTMQVLRGMQQQIELLTQTVDRQEMYTRRKMLLFHGIGEDKQDNLSELIRKTVSDQLNVPNVTTCSIIRCLRMGRAADNKTRPILVEFGDLAIRNQTWYAKKTLKGTGITISEFLTKPRHQAFMEVRQRYGVSKCWTKDGFVYFIGLNGDRHRISSLSELQKIAPKDTVKVPIETVPKEVTASSKTRSVRLATSRK